MILKEAVQGFDSSPAGAGEKQPLNGRDSADSVLPGTVFFNVFYLWLGMGSCAESLKEGKSCKDQMVPLQVDMGGGCAVAELLQSELLSSRTEVCSAPVGL